jgi:hypothetical protein
MLRTLDTHPNLTHALEGMGGMLHTEMDKEMTVFGDHNMCQGRGHMVQVCVDLLSSWTSPILASLGVRIVSIFPPLLGVGRVVSNERRLETFIAHN